MAPKARSPRRHLPSPPPLVAPPTPSWSSRRTLTTPAAPCYSPPSSPRRPRPVPSRRRSRRRTPGPTRAKAAPMLRPLPRPPCPDCGTDDALALRASYRHRPPPALRWLALLFPLHLTRAYACAACHHLVLVKTIRPRPLALHDMLYASKNQGSLVEPLPLRCPTYYTRGRTTAIDRHGRLTGAAPRVTACAPVPHGDGRRTLGRGRRRIRTIRTRAHNGRARARL